MRATRRADGAKNQNTHAFLNAVLDAPLGTPITTCDGRPLCARMRCTSSSAAAAGGPAERLVFAAVACSRLLLRRRAAFAASLFLLPLRLRRWGCDDDGLLFAALLLPCRRSDCLRHRSFC